MMLQDKHALITGASSGIGAALARAYAGKGCHVAVTARREDKLRELAADIERDYGVKTCIVVQDLAKEDAVDHIMGFLSEQHWPVDILVNNAGYGVPGALHKVPWQKHLDFEQVLMRAPVALSYACIPQMRERGFGRIMNVASLAGLVPAGPGHTLYGASKAFLIKFSEALAAECRDSGVQVSALCPGFTYSEFHDVTGTREQVSKMPSYMWKSSAEVASFGIQALEDGKIIAVPGRVNRFLHWLARHLPASWARALILKRSKDFRIE